MAEEIKNEQEIVSEAPKGADAPKAGSGKAEPMQKSGDYEDLGPAVTSPTDKPGQDKTKDKMKKDSGAPTKGAAPAEPMTKVKEDADAEKEDEKEDEKEAEKEANAAAVLVKEEGTKTETAEPAEGDHED